MKVDAKSKMMFERFLIKNDFHIPEYDGRIISFEIDSIKDSYLENLKVNIDDIDKRVYSIDNLPIENKGRISSYVLFSDYYGELLLNGLYVNKNDTIDLIKLLKYSLEIIRNKYKEYKTIKIKILNYEGVYLFSELTKGANVNNEYELLTYRLI